MSPEESETMLQALRTGLDTPGPARPLSERAIAELIAGVAPSRSPGVPVGNRRWRRGALAAVPALVAVAAAAYWMSDESSRALPPAPHSLPRAALQPVLPGTEPAAVGHERGGDAASAPAQDNEPAAAARHSAAQRSADASRPRAVSSTDTIGPEATGPEDILLQANRLRRKGEWQSAEQKYLEVTRVQAGTLSAYVAMASVGSLRLQRDPAAALSIYQRALSQQPGGPLDADIRWGIASAQRALRNSQAERRELEALLRAHPGSAMSDRARARLAELKQ